MIRNSFKFVIGRGFTLVELLVSIAIILLLSAIILPNFRSAEKQFAIQRSAHKLAQDIRRAQEMAMSAKRPEGTVPTGYRYGYGVHLTTSEPTHYILFADLNNNQDYDQGRDRIVEDVTFEGGVRISSLSSSSLRIVFSPPDPTVTIRPSAPATITLDGVKTIRVNSAGLIAIE